MLDFRLNKKKKKSSNKDFGGFFQRKRALKEYFDPSNNFKMTRKCLVLYWQREQNIPKHHILLL